MRKIAVLFSFLFLAFLWDADAQERTGIKKGFELSANSGKTILLFRPSVSVGAQSTGGLFEPNAEWTDQARQNIELALTEQQKKLGNTIIPFPETYGSDELLVSEYRNLFGAVAEAIVTYQFFAGNRLPTKKRANKVGKFEWSLGPGVANLPGADQADYALFIYNKDAYGSTGRKILQVVAILGAGVGVQSGQHIGYAGLVDLKTGDLLWLNADGQMGGDVRKVEGAKKRVRQLLEEFPGSMAEKEE